MYRRNHGSMWQIFMETNSPCSSAASPWWWQCEGILLLRVGSICIQGDGISSSWSAWQPIYTSNVQLYIQYVNTVSCCVVSHLLLRSAAHRQQVITGNKHRIFFIVTPVSVSMPFGKVQFNPGIASNFGPVEKESHIYLHLATFSYNNRQSRLVAFTSGHIFNFSNS